VMTDRRKELIISGGFNIYPTEVEAAVRSMPGVEDVAVVGLPEQSGNESVVAAIVAQAGANITLEEVRAWAEKHIAHYALPRQIAIVQELPRSQIGKVMRRVLREELLNARESAGQAATKAQEAAGQAAVRAQDTASKAQEAAA
ncbi:AMP-binding enzyme, partial [Mycobacterium tuberculosis]